MGWFIEGVKAFNWVSLGLWLRHVRSVWRGLGTGLFDEYGEVLHGSLNVPIEHHPTIRYMVYNGYYKVMSNIPKMGQLPTPVLRIWMWLHQEEPLEASSGTCRSVLDRPKFWCGAHRSIFAAVRGPQQCRSGSLRTGHGDHPGSHGG